MAKEERDVVGLSDSWRWVKREREKEKIVKKERKKEKKERKKGIK